MGLSIDNLSISGESSNGSFNGSVATNVESVVTPASFAVVSDRNNKLYIKSPRVVVDGKLVSLSDVSVSKGGTYYCNVSDSGSVSVSGSSNGKYSVPVCTIGDDGSVTQYHTGLLSVGGGGGGGIRFIGTDKSTNWSGDDNPSAVYKFQSGSDSRVVVKVSGSNTNATIAIDVYYK